ncbi:hypothetical protein [Mesomycoplasma ovipneumoniae]|uniref:hypothetical protein n=1 Tax=Mesomycoplasma ovipneumoniae TaxID=29562 RepID=UPI0015CF7366|nr:hypothetical protein [Mesomycoplasma ovipneumoniae]
MHQKSLNLKLKNPNYTFYKRIWANLEKLKQRKAKQKIKNNLEFLIRFVTRINQY